MLPNMMEKCKIMNRNDSQRQPKQDSYSPIIQQGLLFVLNLKSLLVSVEPD